MMLVLAFVLRVFVIDSTSTFHIGLPLPLPMGGMPPPPI